MSNEPCLHSQDTFMSSTRFNLAIVTTKVAI